MQDNIGMFYISTDGFDEFRTDVRARIYEVIRIIEKVPVFLEQHVDRLNNSLAAFKDGFAVQCEKAAEICSRLCNENNLTECNVQLTYYIYDDESVGEMHYVKQHFYPGKDMYANGVKTDIIRLERSNPSVKNLIPDYKRKVKEEMKDNFELLLVNEAGEILEGSRSNFFYVIGEDVYTAPESLVLNGITRINVIKAIEEAGYRLVEKCLEADRIDKADGAFISGTSINVLPVASIGSHDLKKQGKISQVTLDIENKFEEILSSYIKRCKGEY